MLDDDDDDVPKKNQQLVVKITFIATTIWNGNNVIKKNHAHTFHACFIFELYSHQVARAVYILHEIDLYEIWPTRLAHELRHPNQLRNIKTKYVEELLGVRSP